MKIGIICSSGGSVFSEVYNILNFVYPKKYEFYVITDRKCGVENFCRENNINFERIEEPDNNKFCVIANSVFKKNKIDIVVLFFLRLVTSEMYGNFPTFNFHPSLLPAFQGFNPIQKAIKKRVKFLGATIHQVDKSIDDGPIVGQNIVPFNKNVSEDILNKISYLQKVYLFLLLVDLYEQGTVAKEINQINYDILDTLEYNSFSSPCIANKFLLEAFKKVQDKERLKLF